ncbi:hypothetical protein C8R44DRAFT_748071 [Mycena epipterygia]|nr:hypothetical protein C8R44DRAFT_748071 [Mycena epipterygia]
MLVGLAACVRASHRRLVPANRRLGAVGVLTTSTEVHGAREIASSKTGLPSAAAKGSSFHGIRWNSRCSMSPRLGGISRARKWLLICCSTTPAAVTPHPQFRQIITPLSAALIIAILSACSEMVGCAVTVVGSGRRTKSASRYMRKVGGKEGLEMGRWGWCSKDGLVRPKPGMGESRGSSGMDGLPWVLGGIRGLGLVNKALAELGAALYFEITFWAKELGGGAAATISRGIKRGKSMIWDLPHGRIGEEGFARKKKRKKRKSGL